MTDSNAIDGNDLGDEIMIGGYEHEVVLGVDDLTDDITENYRIYITRDNPLLRYVIYNQVDEVRKWLDDALKKQDERWMHAFFTMDVSN